MCRSDIHFWKTGAIGPLKVEGDCCLGHEASGIVLKVGECVDELVVGKSCRFLTYRFLLAVHQEERSKEERNEVEDSAD